MAPVLQNFKAGGTKGLCWMHTLAVLGGSYIKDPDSDANLNQYQKDIMRTMKKLNEFFTDRQNAEIRTTKEFEEAFAQLQVDLLTMTACDERIKRMGKDVKARWREAFSPASHQ